MQRALIVPGVLALGGLTFAAGGRTGFVEPAHTRWVVDAAHTEVNFNVRHFFTPVRGAFRDFEVTLDFDPDNPDLNKVEVRIDVASIDTRNERRDNHLRSGDWFEVERYPHITFRSTAVRGTGPNQLAAREILTIKETTPVIELPIRILGITDIPVQMR